MHTHREKAQTQSQTWDMTPRLSRKERTERGTPRANAGLCFGAQRLGLGAHRASLGTVRSVHVGAVGTVIAVAIIIVIVASVGNAQTSDAWEAIGRTFIRVTRKASASTSIPRPNLGRLGQGVGQVVVVVVVVVHDFPQLGQNAHTTTGDHAHTK